MPKAGPPQLNVIATFLFPGAGDVSILLTFPTHADGKGGRRRVLHSAEFVASEARPKTVLIRGIVWADRAKPRGRPRARRALPENGAVVRSRLTTEPM